MRFTLFSTSYLSFIFRDDAESSLWIALRPIHDSIIRHPADCCNSAGDNHLHQGFSCR
jgi:hypothetical protein